MKILKTGMRLWITAISLFSFLIGWVFFAHSGKPAPLQFNQPAQTVIASNQTQLFFGRNSQSGGLPFSGQNQAPFSRRRLRTGGS